MSDLNKEDSVEALERSPRTLDSVIQEIPELSGGKLEYTAQSKWFLLSSSDPEDKKRQSDKRGRRLLSGIDAYIKSTANPCFDEESRLAAKRFIDYERNVFKVHLKVPIRYKAQILELIAREVRDFEMFVTTFKVYYDQVEAAEDAKHPDDSIASFVFYFGETPTDSVQEDSSKRRNREIKMMKSFVGMLASILANSGISEELKATPPLLPRFSFQTKLSNGTILYGLSVVQGDGDFKIRNLFNPKAKEELLDPATNYAFFREDAEVLSKQFSDIHFM